MVNHFLVWLLGILEDEVARTISGGAAMDAVDEVVDIAAGVKDQANFVEGDIRGLLGLRAEIAGARGVGVARIVQHEIRRTQHHVVRREVLHKVAAGCAARTLRLHAAVPRTAGELRQRVIDRAVVVVNERAVQRGVVQVREANGPAVGVRGREPQMIGGKRPHHLRVAPAQHAFARHRVIRETARQARGRKEMVGELIGRAQAVRGLHVKRNRALGRLAGERGAVEAVIRDGIAAGAGIIHGQRGEHRGRDGGGAVFQTITKRHPSEAVGIVGAAGDHHVFTGGRHHGQVRNSVDGRAGVGDQTAVGRARGAEVGGQGHSSKRLGTAAAQAEQDFRPATQPAHLAANGDRCGHSAAGGTGQCDTQLVTAVVAAGFGTNVQALRATEPDVLDGGHVMRAVEHPWADAVFKTRIGHQVGARAVLNFDFVQQAFANTELEDLKMVAVEREGFARSRRAGGADELNSRPRTLGGFIAVPPVARLAVVAVRIL